MRERPIIMSSESVRAILAGTKTQTRRVVRIRDFADTDKQPEISRCPYGRGGGHLWVKEAWRPYIRIGTINERGDQGVTYLADKSQKSDPRGGPLFQTAKALASRSPLFMPRWASRLTLEITEIRVQRVQEISEEDAKYEGVPMGCQCCFAERWDALNAKRGFPWSENPWVWALSFQLVIAIAAAEAMGGGK